MRTAVILGGLAVTTEYWEETQADGTRETGCRVQLRLVRNYLDLAMGISNSGCDLAAMANALATLERFGIGRGRA